MAKVILGLTISLDGFAEDRLNFPASSYRVQVYQKIALGQLQVQGSRQPVAWLSSRKLRVPWVSWFSKTQVG